MAYATGSTGLAITVRGSSRRIMIMRFRPANIRLINRRSNLPRLLLALSSINGKCNDKNNTTNVQGLTGHSISGRLNEAAAAASFKSASRQECRNRGDSRISRHRAAPNAKPHRTYVVKNLDMGNRCTAHTVVLADPRARAVALFSGCR